MSPWLGTPRGVDPPRRLLAFDLETSGLDARRDGIVAVGWVPIDGATIRWGGAFRALVDDPRPNTPGAERSLGIHQILPSEASGGLGPRELIERVLDELQSGRVLLVHGASIERAFLAATAARAGLPAATWPAVDTLAYLRAIEAVRLHVQDRLGESNRLARHVPTVLAEARRFFDLPEYPAHDPLLDALAAAELYLLLARRFPELHPKVQD